MLERLGKAKILSKLDPRSAYNLIRIKEGDEYKTAITCSFGHFEYIITLFELKNTPTVFQHFINDVLEDVIGKFAYTYINGIIIFYKDYNSHLAYVKEIHIRLRKAELFTKLEKYEFFVLYIDFLGNGISFEGIFMDPKRLTLF